MKLSGARKGPILEQLYSIHHEKLFYCGMDVLTPYITWGAQGKAPVEGEELLIEYARRISEIEQVPLLKFKRPLVV